MKPSPRRIRSIDGLRAVLALAVAGYHLGVPGAQWGVLAVPAFFALSGLLITGFLLARLHVDGTVELRRFLVDRALRIGTPVAAVVVGVGVLWPIAVDHQQTSPFSSVAGAALTCTTNVFRAYTDFRAGPLEPLWSVAAESQFYLLWPVALVVAIRRGRESLLVWSLPVCIVALVVVSGASGLVGAPHSAPPAYYSVTLSFACALVGALGALAVHSLPWLDVPSRRVGRALTWLGAAGTIVLAVSMPGDWKTQPWVILVAIPLTSASVTVLALGLSTTATTLGRGLATGALAWFGRHASYSLYLWHLPVYAVLEPVLDGPLGRCTMALIAVLVALASASLIERPVALIRAALASRRRRSAGEPR